MVGSPLIPNRRPEPPWFSEEHRKWQMARRRQLLRTGLQDDLFRRVPTDEEKRRYRQLWGGLSPWRCALGLLYGFCIGLLLGLNL